MPIKLEKVRFLERGAVVTLSSGNLLARADYESPEVGQEINLDLSVFLLDCYGNIPSADHVIFYNNQHSPDGSIEWFDDEVDLGNTGEMTLGLDLSRVENNVLQIVLILTIHEPKLKNQNISHLNRPYIRFCDGEIELYRFEPVCDKSALSLEFCRFIRNGSSWVLVATGVGSPKELIDHVAHLL